MSTTVLDRRSLLKATGSFALAFSLAGVPALGQSPAPRLPGSLSSNRKLDAWIRINADGTVTLLTGKVELGQGILTAFTQLCADELDVDIGRVRVISGDTGLCPNEGTTAGSFSMPNGGTAVRLAAAEVRHILVQMAAEHLGLPAERLEVKDGTVTEREGSRSTTYWELLGGRKLERDATASIKPKPIRQRRYIGQSVPRIDLPAKVTGEAAFVQDLRPDGLVHGRVVRQPAYGARLVGVDTAAVEAMPGVIRVVRNGDFLAVVAEKEWQAIAAAKALRQAARWEERQALPTHAGIYDWLLAQKTRDIAIKSDARGEGPAPARVLEATYRRPYQMHASIGPSAAIAEMRDDILTIDTHSQSVFETAVAIAHMVGLPPAKVRCRHRDGAGCYGHNGADDAAADAALLARELPGRPVRVQWMREDEHAWEPYGSAMVLKVKAGLDGKGDVLDWDYQLWSTPHGTRPGGNPGNLLTGRMLANAFAMPEPQNGGPPNFAADRNAIALYGFPGHKVTTHFITEMPLRVSSHRGLGAYANVFAIESFMDELALAAGADPLEYRLRQTPDERGRAVMRKAAERFGWAKFSKSPGRGRGIAYARYKTVATYCAVCLEVEVDRASGAVKVVRAVVAGDAGEAVSPDGIANQLEGGLIQSLSWTLKEEVRFDDRRVLSRDWDSYPILTFSEVPPVEVEIVDRPGQPFLGAGEASQGPTAAALANAIADAVGVRLRELPLTPEKVKKALA
ncbi:MAG TPA: molybdopterin cofactor-binding domain-containing protein [Beijerinckiaceae bacterium]|jgi:CO/xanthine dehydrogenase Mo-binding subunit